MALQKPLHVAEFPFQQVGHVRDVQLRKILKAKQPWKMPLQAVASTAQLLVRVVRLACFRIYAAPAQEGFVPRQPVMQVRGKAVFATVRECQRKRPQFACRLAFGFGSGGDGSCIDVEIQCQAGQRAAYPAESKNELRAVEDGGEDDGAVDTADECGNYGAGSGTV